jgi:hypothetical protein
VELKSNSYVDFNSPGTEFARGSGRALFGAFHTNALDYCIHLFAQDATAPLAYVSSIPFLMTAYAAEEIKKMPRTSLGWLYPTEPVQIFEAYVSRSPNVPIRVGCAETIWVCSYLVSGARAGRHVFAGA